MKFNRSVKECVARKQTNPTKTQRSRIPLQRISMSSILPCLKLVPTSNVPVTKAALAAPKTRVVAPAACAASLRKRKGMDVAAVALAVPLAVLLVDVRVKSASASSKV